MARTLTLVLASLLLSLGAYAVEYADLLRRADSLVSFLENDFSAEYTFVQDIPGEGRSVTKAAVFRRDGEAKYVIIVLEPSVNRGQGYLKVDETLWFYDPYSRRYNTSSAKDRFQNSNARNSDFTQSTLAQDYRVVSGSEERLGRFDCWLLELRATTDEVAYPKMKLWISKDGLVRKYEDYSLSGRLLRTTAVPAYTRVGERYVPQKLLIVDALRGAEIDGRFRYEQTQISIAKPSLKTLPDSVFSKSFLESVSR